MEAHAQRLSIHTPGEAPQAEQLVTRTFPRVLLTWKTHSGEPLSGEAFKAAVELWDRRGGTPGLLELSHSEFGPALGASEGASRRYWVPALEEERLAKVLTNILKRRRGPKGRLLIYVFDARRIAARRGLRVQSNPQRQLEFAAGSQEDGAACVRSAAGVAGGTGCCATEDPQSADAVQAAADGNIAGVDPLSALKASLKSELGKERYELWLQPCQFSFSAAGLRIAVADEFKRTYMRRFLLRDIEATLPGVRVNLVAADTDRAPPRTSALSLVRVAKTRADSPACPGGSAGQFVGSAGGTDELAQTTKQENQTQTQPNSTNQTAREEISEGNSSEPTAVPPSEKEKPPSRLIEQAAAWHHRISDDGLYPWFTIMAALAVEEGAIAAGDVEHLIGDDPWHFATRLKELLCTAGCNLGSFVAVKTACHRRGIAWQRRWERSRKQIDRDYEQRQRERVASFRR